MPVSSPSYFPPARADGTVVGQTAGNNATGDRCFLALDDAGLGSTVNDLIILGDHAGDAGITDADLAGSIILGNNAAGALTVNLGSSSYENPNLIIGFNAAPVALSIGDCMVIGNDALLAYTGNFGGPHNAGTPVGCTFIGNQVVGNLNGTVGNGNPPADSVVLGHRAAFGTTGADWFLQSSVVIGAQACEQVGGGLGSGSQLQDDVVIGYRAGRGLGASNNGGTQSVIIGAGACQSGAAIRECVYIGSGANVGAGGTTRGMIVIGNGAAGNGTNTTVIGASAVWSGDRSIIIGALADTAVTDDDDRLVIGTDQGRFAYAELDTGNVLLGDSVAGGALLDFGTGAPTNVLKLVNGSAASSNPSGGGYFYCAAAANAALHWVQSDGTDTLIAGGGGSQLKGRGTFTAAAGANNNVTPDSSVNIQTINRLFVNTAAGAANITGITAGYDGQMLWVSVTGGNALTLNDENAGSTADNRLSGSSDLVFADGDNTLLVYDATIDRWMMGV